MRTSLLLTILLLPLTSQALDFEHRDTVLLTDINGITSGRLGRAVGVNQGSVFMGAPEQDLQDGATYLYNISDQRNMEFVKEFVSQDPTLFIWLSHRHRWRCCRSWIRFPQPNRNLRSER